MTTTIKKALLIISLITLTMLIGEGIVSARFDSPSRPIALEFDGTFERSPRWEWEATKGAVEYLVILNGEEAERSADTFFIPKAPLKPGMHRVEIVAISKQRVQSKPSHPVHTVIFNKRFKMGADNKLPQFTIKTNNQTIIDEPKIEAILSIADPEPEEGSGTEQNYPIGIEIRGQSSQKFPFKKGFGFTLRKTASRSAKVPLLGLPKASSWILHGPITDKSLIRNHAVFQIAGAVGLETPESRFIELFISADESNETRFDQYRGVYLLLEKIEVSKSRLNLAKLDIKDKRAPKINGGYLLEYTERNKVGADDLTFGGNIDNTFVVHYPKAKGMNLQQLASIEGYIESLSHELRQLGKGRRSQYEDFLNVDSMIDFMLLSDLVKNADSFKASTYMHKDRNQKLRLGPLWDMNLTFGNFYSKDFIENHELKSDPRRRSVFKGNNKLWVADLLRSEEFIARYKRRWEQHRRGPWRTENLQQMLKYSVDRVSVAAQQNFRKWPVLEHQLDNVYGPKPKTHAMAVRLLSKWLTTRARCLDKYLALPTKALIQDNGTLLTQTCRNLRQP